MQADQNVAGFFVQMKDNIELANIQQELTRLWDSLEGANKIRACLFNLVVYTCDEQRNDYFQGLIKLVIDRLPCRILFVKGKKDPNTHHIKTQVSAETSGTGNSSIACEVITVEASGVHLERVPFVILPNIVPDLPVYLLWGGDPTSDDPNFTPLQKIATRLIFDSECLSDLPGFSRTLIKRLPDIQPEVADMNWARTRGWRDIISQVFDTQEKVEHLSESKKIRITYNQRETADFRHTHTQALFIQGWIAAQLNWKFCNCQQAEGNIHIDYENGSRSISVTLSPGLAEDHSPGTLLEVEVQTHKGQHYSLKRQPKSKVVEVRESSSAHCGLPYKLLLGRLTVDRSLMNEVLYENLGNHYHNMIQLTSQIPCQLV